MARMVTPIYEHIKSCTINSNLNLNLMVIERKRCMSNDLDIARTLYGTGKVKCDGEGEGSRGGWVWVI